MIIEGEYLHGRPCGKIIYTPSSGKSDRQQFHDLVVTGLEESGDNGCDLEASLQSVIAFMEGKGIISEAINMP